MYIQEYRLHRSWAEPEPINTHIYHGVNWPVLYPANLHSHYIEKPDIRGISGIFLPVSKGGNYIQTWLSLFSLHIKFAVWSRFEYQTGIFKKL